MPESSSKLSSQIKIDLLIFRSSLKQCWSQNFIYLTQKTKICCTIAFQINQFTLQTHEQLVHGSGLRGLRNHFLGPICHLLHKDKELLALRNNFRLNKKILIAKFESRSFNWMQIKRVLSPISCTLTPADTIMSY